jgi:DNA-binding transcriptional regulator YbjK
MSNDKEDLGDTLEKSYHSISKLVEDLVAKEGKNIKEAFVLAEEKLSEWGELGREEANSISEEVMHDLSSLGETIEEAKDSFKQKWQLDSEYLTDSTWNMLSRVADKTTLSLMEFNKDLQEHVDEATKDLHEREHKDHRQWHSDHEMWQDDIETWIGEYAQASKDLTVVQDSIYQRIEQLKEHAKTISAHEYIDKVHEKDIARSEQNPDNPVLEVINDHNEEAYEDMISRHKDEAITHKEFKDDYRRMMSLIAKLKKLTNPSDYQ